MLENIDQRIPMPDKPVMESVGVRIEREALDRIVSIARRDGTNKTRVMRHLILHALPLYDADCPNTVPNCATCPRTAELAPAADPDRKRKAKEMKADLFDLLALSEHPELAGECPVCGAIEGEDHKVPCLMAHYLIKLSPYNRRKKKLRRKEGSDERVVQGDEAPAVSSVRANELVRRLRDMRQGRVHEDGVGTGG